MEPRDPVHGESGGRTVLVQCPACGHESERIVRLVQISDELTCPVCGSPIPLDAEELVRDIREMDDAWADPLRGESGLDEP